MKKCFALLMIAGILLSFTGCDRADSLGLYVLTQVQYEDDPYQIYSYHENGLESKCCFYEEGQALSYCTRTYNKKGNLICYTSGSGDQLTEDFRRQITYNINSDETLSIGYDSQGEEVERTTSAYDIDGNLLRMQYQYLDASSGTSIRWQTEETFYTYNENGNRLTGTVYQNGIEYKQIKYFYNGAGQLIQEVVRYLCSSYQETYKYLYEYDDNGNMITQIVMKNGTELDRYQYAYNENGDQTLYARYANGLRNPVTIRQEFVFNQYRGYTSVTTTKKGETTVNEYTYAFDETGCTVTISDSPYTLRYTKLQLTDEQIAKLPVGKDADGDKFIQYILVP